ncbi:MAG: MBL fold metallo-hydrolase [Deltaproteobacteria bacterium]|nr:MBL fold metallo-hydrolase [Deltaproteobacteria bacterium]
MEQRIARGVHLVGGAGLSDGADCLCYGLDLGVPVLIDCGAFPSSWPLIRENMCRAGLRPEELHTLVLTHAHIDHAGGAAAAVAETGCRVVAHELDADTLERGERRRSAADWYRTELQPVPVHLRMQGAEERLDFPDASLLLLHSPGHTPGSICAYLDVEDGDRRTRVLFGQDIHGPFHPDFGSDREAHRRSLERLLALEADLLCEGHHGVFHGKDEVRAFIEQFL